MQIAGHSENFCWTLYSWLYCTEEWVIIISFLAISNLNIYLIYGQYNLSFGPVFGFFSFSLVFCIFKRERERGLWIWIKMKPNHFNWKINPPQNSCIETFFNLCIGFGCQEKKRSVIRIDFFYSFRLIFFPSKKS